MRAIEHGVSYLKTQFARVRAIPLLVPWLATELARGGQQGRVISVAVAVQRVSNRHVQPVVEKADWEVQQTAEG